MRKSLSTKRYEAGFYLPYISFVCMLVFMMIGTSVVLYKNHLQMTHKMMEWTRVETMIQMTTATFVNDELYNKPEGGETTYNFPDGTVDMSYKEEAAGKWLLHIKIKTKRDFDFADYYIVTVPGSSGEAEDTS